MLDLRTVPALAFRYDTGIERGARMFELLREEEQALAENPHESEDDASPGAGVGAPDAAERGA
jgi:hypothetical protein